MSKHITKRNEVNYPQKISKDKAIRLFDKGLKTEVNTIYSLDNVYVKVDGIVYEKKT